jgi:uncharacterized cupin superfamily protein
MSNSIVIETPASSGLEPAPISSDWILAGTPEARSKMLVKSRDRTSSIAVWECTAGRFNWHYSEDETVVVISGEVFAKAIWHSSLAVAPVHGVSLSGSKR